MTARGQNKEQIVLAKGFALMLIGRVSIVSLPEATKPWLDLIVVKSISSQYRRP